MRPKHSVCLMPCEYEILGAMKKWFYRILWAPAFIVTVLFLIANRQPVAISFDPFSAADPSVATMPLPLWMWLIAMVLIGFAMGAVGMWLSAGPSRAKARIEHHELKAVNRALTQERRRREEAEQALDAARRDGHSPLLEVRQASLSD